MVIGMIEEDGSYVMNAVAGRKGVVPGEYKVASLPAISAGDWFVQTPGSWTA